MGTFNKASDPRMLYLFKIGPGDFLCQYPIETFLSVMWKLVANIWEFPKKSFSFLAALLHNLTINFIYATVFRFV